MIDRHGGDAEQDFIRHDWIQTEILNLFYQPLNDLVFQAQALHRRYFDPNVIQLSTLLNIKTGGCPEDCAYCPQSARYQTSINAEPLMSLDKVRAAAEQAKGQGASRFCMGAAWRSPKDRDLDQVLEMVRTVKQSGLETCATLGMLTEEQALRLKEAGLDFYNHNLDSSAGFYRTIISTRTYEDRLQTLKAVRQAGMSVCCGGIIGMGEDLQDRAELLRVLATMHKHPESVPINLLVRVEGTPLYGVENLDPFEIVRTIAVARILMPASYVRLSAGRTGMNDELQALCFFAGANSIFYGEKLLTTDNPELDKDQKLFKRLGLKALH
ncbi:MAG: biotin synthase [Gammaproteobacteria bacterium]|nr:biotin synthase [Gammaproteobacteria bacterium]